MQNAQARSALITVLALVVLDVPDVSAQKTPLSAPAQQLRREIMAGDVQGASHGDLARYRAALLRIYSDSSASALWLTQGKPTRQGELLLAELRAAEMRGLRASDYDAELLARRLTGDAAWWRGTATHRRMADSLGDPFRGSSASGARGSSRTSFRATVDA